MAESASAHFIYCLRAAAYHPLIAFRGAREFRSGFGLTYDNDPWSAKSEAYDSGREIAHLLTGRRFDG